MELEKSSEGWLIGPGVVGPVAAHDDCRTKVPTMLIGQDGYEKTARDRSRSVTGTESFRSGGLD